MSDKPTPRQRHARAQNFTLYQLGGIRAILAALTEAPPEEIHPSIDRECLRKALLLIERSIS